LRKEKGIYYYAVTSVESLRKYQGRDRGTDFLGHGEKNLGRKEACWGHTVRARLVRADGLGEVLPAKKKPMKNPKKKKK